MADTTGKKKIPNIRFKGFTDAWEQRKLGDQYQQIGNAFVGTATPYYVESGHFYLESNNIKSGHINHDHEVFINDEFYQKQEDKYLHTNDLVMVQSGHVGDTAVVEEKYNNSAAHALIMFRNPKISSISYFLNEYFQSPTAKNRIKVLAIGNTISHILASDMIKFRVTMPYKSEQIKISNLLKVLDKLIALYQRKLGLLEQLKKGMLQKLFANSNTKQPELRFKGCEGEWEQQRLGDLGNIKSGVGFPENEQGGKTGIPFYKVSDMNIPGNQSSMQVSNNYVSNEQIQRRHWKPITTVPALIFAKVGAALMLDRKRLVEHPFLIDNNTMSYSLTDSWDKYFAITLFHNVYLPQYAQVGALPSLNASDIKVIKVKLPNLNEQRRIGEVFKLMDSTISLHHGKINMLTHLKKFLLQQMFI